MIQSAPPPQPVRELPIAETIGEAYRSVLGNFGTWFKIMLAPAALAIPLSVLSRILLAPEEAKFAGQNMGDPEVLSALIQSAWPELTISYLLSLIYYVLFAVAWHRYLLLGEKPASAIATLRPDARHLRFYLYTIYLLLIASGLLAVLLFVGGSILGLFGGAAVALRLLFSLFVLVFLFYAVARLQFAFAAVAVDEQYGFLDSWRNTRGQGWRFLTVLACCTLPPMFFNLFMFALFGGAQGNSFLALINSFVLAAVGLLCIAILISAISCAFRTCTGWIPPQAPSPPASV